jgi:hypothetical protein|tara:strand:+ start:128 stop:409 length:282 start_codon:yes stop_codon:yes gene_type:complete
MAKKNITPNKERMYSYAKSGGLNGFRNGGGVLDNKQRGGLVSVIKKVAKNVKRAAAAVTPTVDGGKLPIKKSTLNDFLNETPEKVVKKKVKNK